MPGRLGAFGRPDARPKLTLVLTPTPTVPGVDPWIRTGTPEITGPGPVPVPVPVPVNRSR